MKKYEYQTYNWTDVSDEEFLVEMNNLGDQGWQISFANPVAEEILLMREKPIEVRIP